MKIINLLLIIYINIEYLFLIKLEINNSPEDNFNKKDIINNFEKGILIN